MKKTFLVALLFFAISAQAQENALLNKVKRLVTKPAAVDSAYIYQPRPSFSLGVFSTGQRAGFNTEVDFRVDSPDGGSFSGTSNYSLSENLCKKVGLEVGYGKVILGYGLEIGPRSASKKTAFGFNFVGKTWGIHINYFKISNPFTTGLTIGSEGDEDYFHDEFTSDEHATLRDLAIDGYYAFNNKRFAYPAAYKIGLVQRRTAGSWMLTARYMQGELFNSPEATWDSYNMLDCFNTLQISVGGGYSVNFVLWHKDPADARDHGLRNLTVNLTATPVITLVNYLKCVSYDSDLDSDQVEETRYKVLCYPMPNYIGSAAASLTLGRFFFSTQFTYNWFYFSSRNALDRSQLIPDYVDGLDFNGNFRDWTLKGLLVYRF